MKPPDKPGIELSDADIDDLYEQCMKREDVKREIESKDQMIERSTR